MYKIKFVAMLGICTLISACGHSTSDRALSGAGIGAGVGALGSAIVGGPVLGGAIVGGAVGAAAGGLTKEDQIDMGKPVWK